MFHLLIFRLQIVLQLHEPTECTPSPASPVTIQQLPWCAVGSYTFNVAQNQSETVNYRVTNNNASSWNIDFSPNPTLTLTRGNTYVFNLSQSFPWAFYFKTELSLGTTNVYSDGVFNNGAATGLITFTVPQDAPDTLYYCNDIETNLRGQLNIIDGTPGTGPGFWIQ